MKLRTNAIKFGVNVMPAVALLGWASTCSPAAHADGAGDKKRDILAGMKRVAAISPFFGTDTLKQAEAASGESSKIAAKNAKYIEDLKLLQAHAQTLFPERVAVRLPFQTIPAAEVARALEDAGLTPEKLFENGGRMHGGRFAAPDAAAIKKLAAACHADAVVLGTLDEPRKTNGRYYVDVSGVGYNSPHVRDKAGFFMMAANGTEILHDFVEVLHPVSNIGSRKFLMADWTETEDAVIEDFMDEITRYAPDKSGPVGILAHKSPRK